MRRQPRPRPAVGLVPSPRVPRNWLSSVYLTGRVTLSLGTSSPFGRVSCAGVRPERPASRERTLHLVWNRTERPAKEVAGQPARSLLHVCDCQAQTGVDLCQPP